MIENKNELEKIKNATNSKTSRSTVIFAEMFLLFIILLSLFSIYSCFPFKQTTDIALVGEDGLKHQKFGQEFSLKAKDYKIINMFDEKEWVSRFLLWDVKTLSFYNVLVTDNNGNEFIMAVRVCKETENLKNGIPVDLKGMVSNSIDSNASTAQYCLNTEIDSIGVSILKMIVFVVIIFLCIHVLIIIIRKQRNKN